MFEKGQRYVTDLTGTNILTVKDVFKKGEMCTVSAGETGRNIMCGQDRLMQEPHLCYVHKGKQEIQMRILK